MRQAVWWRAAAVLSVSCAPAGPAAESAPARTPVSSVASSHVEPHAAAPSKDSALQERLSGALAYVSEIRHLPALSPVKGRLISRAEIAQYLTAQLDQETPTDFIQATEALLYGLGTVDVAFDFRASVI